MPAPSFNGGFGGSKNDETAGPLAAETGIHVGDIDATEDNPEIEFLDRWAGVIGTTTGHNPSLTINITGEMADVAAGVNIATWVAAATVGNIDSFASASSTHHGIDYSLSLALLRSASGSMPRGGARTVSLSFVKRLALIANV